MLMRFTNVGFTYPCEEKPTVKNFTLEVEKGKCYGLIGHNGCGKTTFFRLANGLYPVTKGEIYWQNQRLTYDSQCLRQWRQNVGLVFQDPNQQLVAATVEEDLSYGLCNLGLPSEEIEIRVNDTLQDFNLTKLAHFPVNYLSLGQKRRLAIADVMILKPKILLLDEPTAFLDPIQVRDLRQQLEKINSEGTTIILATHDLNWVYDWADWILVMNRGSLILQGKPEDLKHQEGFFYGDSMD